MNDMWLGDIKNEEQRELRNVSRSNSQEVDKEERNKSKDMKRVLINPIK